MFLLGADSTYKPLSRVQGLLFSSIYYDLYNERKDLFKDNNDAITLYLREDLSAGKLKSSKNLIYKIDPIKWRPKDHCWQFKLPQRISTFNSHIKYKLEVYQGNQLLQSSGPCEIRSRKDGKDDCFGNEIKGYVKTVKKRKGTATNSSSQIHDDSINMTTFIPQLGLVADFQQSAPSVQPQQIMQLVQQSIYVQLMLQSLSTTFSFQQPLSPLYFEANHQLLGTAPAFIQLHSSSEVRHTPTSEHYGAIKFEKQSTFSPEPAALEQQQQQQQQQLQSEQTASHFHEPSSYTSMLDWIEDTKPITLHDDVHDPDDFIDQFFSKLNNSSQ